MSDFYEVTYVLSPVLEEDETKKLVETVNSWIEAEGGKIEEVNEWGLKKFATPMEGKTNGYYVNMYFSGPGAVLPALERQINIHDHILRHLALKYDAKMKRHRELIKKGDLPTILEVEETASEEAEA